ncbi:unnamed protein product [Prunus armeniaca]|uniref:Uncharacterized protein n=1 Tax=Prunus armeniaca TaxID=36596 RepID=A0A6J5V3T9_PRUAR|nr:unnamed protein product [Prunus armeniaca]
MASLPWCQSTKKGTRTRYSRPAILASLILTFYSTFRPITAPNSPPRHNLPEKQSNGVDFTVKPVDGFDASPTFKPDLPEKGLNVVDVGANSLAVKVEKVDDPNFEVCKNMPVL